MSDAGSHQFDSCGALDLSSAASSGCQSAKVSDEETETSDTGDSGGKRSSEEEEEASQRKRMRGEQGARRRNIRDVLDMLPGPSFEDTQQIAMGGGGQQRRRGPGDKKVVLVFYVGGVTMAEVAALRWLSNREGAGVEYVIATTSVITGNSFIRTLYDKLEAPIF